MNDEPATEKQVKFMRNLNIEVPNGITKMEARLAIDRVLKKGEEDDMQKPEVVKVNVGEIPKPIAIMKANGNGSMYASYAKDVFCALRGENNNASEEHTMNQAIDLVKQAKEAFE